MYFVEVFEDGELVGGFYGVLLGVVFFGESMFLCRINVFKICLVYLVECLCEWCFCLFDM